MTRYVGPAYSENGLLTAKEASTEAALWSASRIIEERSNLLRKIGWKEKESGALKVAATYFRRAEELEVQIAHLKNVLFIAVWD